MFTGIIRHVGTVVAVTTTPAGRALRIELGPLSHGLRLGDSVAIDGACLSATSLAPQAATFDVIHETLGRTTLGRLKTGSRVNLERALQPGEGLEGHIVQGHVDGLARLERVDRSGGQWVAHFACDRALTDAMIPKGSIAIAGVSLTLVDVADGRFSVALIPTTLKDTSMAQLQPGDPVNVETDVLGKYVRRYLAQLAATPSGGGLTLEKLRESGFA